MRSRDYRAVRMLGNNENKNIVSTLFTVAVLSAFGIAGNWLTIPAAYGVSFIFGSIFTVVAVGLFGVWWGTAVALFSSSYTYFLWGHPYAIAIFTAEAIWIGIALKRGNSSVLLIDALYWCTLGPILLLLFYGGVMKLGTQSVMIVMLKQAINGMLNALIAGAILLYAPLRRWIKRDQGDSKSPYSTILLYFTTAFLMIPTVILLLLLNYLQIKSSHANIAQYVKTEAAQTERVISHWLTGNMEAVKSVADLGNEYPLEPSARLQDVLETIKGSFPDFHNFYLADTTGTTVAFYPSRNERGESTIGINFSDRSYYAQLKETMRPVVSDVFLGRGGVFSEIFSICVPIIKNGKFAGFGLGAINLDRLRKFLIEVSGQTKTTYTILDRNNTNIVSTNSDRKPLDRLPQTKASIEESTAPGVFLRIPGSKKNISIMDAWKDAAYFTKVPIADSGWVLFVEYSISPLQKHFYNTTIQGLIIVSVLFLFAVLISPWLTGKITRPLARLTVLSRDIPDRIEKQDLIDWPSTGIVEMWELIANFMQTSEALRLKIEGIKAANFLLEDEQVKLRTRIREQHCLYKVFALTADLESPIGPQLLEIANVVSSGWQYPEIAAVRIEYGGMIYKTPDFNETPWMQMAEAKTGQGDVVRITVSYLKERPQEEEGSFLKEERELLKAILYRIVDAVDRRLTAAKLLESEEKYRTIADFTYDWETWIGIDNIYRYVSPSCERITGYRADEFMENPVLMFDITHPEDKSAVKEHFCDSCEEFDTFSLDFRIITKNGDERWISHLCSPVYDRDGRLIGRRGSNRDITEKRQAENILRESEERYRILVETANEGIWTMDADHRTTYVNPAMAVMLGYAPSEIIGKRVEEFFFSEDSSFHQERMERRHTGKDEVYERRFRRRDGSQLWTLVSAKALKDDQGSFTGSFAMFTDITERKSAEDSLRESESRFRGYFELGLVGMAITSLEKNWVQFNDRLCEILGYPREELSLLSWAELTHPDDLAADVAHFDRVLRGEIDSYRMEKRFIRKNGEIVNAQISVQCIRSADGATDHFVAMVDDITERKKAEETLSERSRQLQETVLELERAQNMLQLVIESIPARVFWKDRESRFLGCNSLFAHDAGLNHPRELLGQNDFTMKWAEQADLYRADDLSVIESGVPKMNIVEPQTTPSGTKIWVSTSKVPLHSPDGKIFGVLGVFEDITDRKLAEDRLMKSERRFRSILDQAADSIMVHDLHGRLLDVNQQACKSLGYSKEELLAMNVSDIDPESIADGRDKLWEPISKGKRFTFESHIIRKDGSMFPVEINAGPIEVEEEILVLGIVRDISERKQAEQELRDSEARFKALHNASFGGIAIHDRGIILDCNQGLAEMTGYSEAELIGMDGLLLLAEQSRNTVRQNILSGYEKPYEVIGLHKDGTEYPVRLEARNIPYKGKSVRTVEFRDISESKRDEELRKVLQDQLTQAQKMESVGRLAGGVAHDFNNMLSIILGGAEMALDHPDLPEPIQADLEEIRKAANRSSDLTRQLLAFARKQAISPKVLNLNEAVEGILKMLRRLVGENIDLVWLPVSNVWPIRMDPSQIDQLLANLCVNARDAIEDVGKMTIETGKAIFDEAYCKDHAGFIPGEYALLAVSDDGFGMSQETLKNIFEPFFTTKEIGKGTGLGLATVYGIVKQNNGFINVYSETGKGTTFKIYLPRYEEIAKQIPQKVQEVKTAGGSETILLVEDEPTILKMTTMMLERLGYHVVGAPKPSEAIRMASEHSGEIQLLMTDVVMPEMNGRDLAMHLLSYYPNMKCLFMSGYTANVIAHRGVLDEGVNFIEKPFSRQDLVSMVRKALSETK